MIWLSTILDVISVQLAQFAYPIMSACALFWMIISWLEWKKTGALHRLTSSFFMLVIFLQFNWLFVLAGFPWLITDIAPYRPYIRLGWSIVSLTWLMHSAVMVRGTILETLAYHDRKEERVPLG